MIMGWVLGIFVGCACLCAILNGTGAELAAAISAGAQAGITLTISLAGSLCLWSGVGALMKAVGITDFLARCIRPVLWKLFPSARKNDALAGYLSGNICANFLGLGNAATPMGIQAVKKLAKYSPVSASEEMCRFIVLNTASIQLIPTTVAAIRGSLGSESPFDILPAVWLTSICAAAAGLGCAYLLGKVWKDG